MITHGTGKTIKNCLKFVENAEIYNPWKVSRYGVFSGPYFSGNYGPEKTPYFDTFQVEIYVKLVWKYHYMTNENFLSEWNYILQLIKH